RTGQLLDVVARLLGVHHPGAVELERAVGHPAVAVTGVVDAGVPAVQQLEQVVLRLVVGARVANLRDRQLGVLDAHLLLAAFAEGTAVEADDRGMPEVAVDATEAGGIGHRHVAVVGPGHALGHQHLLVLGRVHVALAAHDQLGALHRAVAPDFRVVAVVADDQAELQALGTFADVGAVARVPALDGAPGDALAVLLADLALVVDQYQGVVGRLVRMLLVALAGQREDPPGLRLATGGGEDRGFLAGNGGGGRHHLVGVVHDPHGAVFREHHQIHAGQTDLHALDHLGDP